MVEIVPMGEKKAAVVLEGLDDADFLSWHKRYCLLHFTVDKALVHESWNDGLAVYSCHESAQQNGQP